MIGRHLTFLPAALLTALLGANTAHAEFQTTASAPNPLAEPRFESVGARSIPRGVVAALAQDRAGFLWIATGDGLVRYDGHRFRPQERASDIPAHRNLGWIRSMLAARDGRLWIGTESDGLAVYDPKTEQVTSYRGDGGTTGVPPMIQALAEDQDGAVWVGTAGGGLDRFDPARATYTHHRHSSQPGSLPDDRVQALLVDRRGTLWVGTWQGLSRRVRGSDHFEPVLSNPLTTGDSGLAGRSVTALFEASDGRIWVGTQQGDIAIVDPATAQGQRVDQGAAVATESPDPVSCLLESPAGQMWVGRASGIDLYGVHDAHLQRRLRHDPRYPAGLAGAQVTSLVLDRAGWIWVGGLGGGLQRHNPNNRSIWVRGADPAPDSPFADADVRSVLALDNGEIWAATHNPGVAVTDAQLRVIGALHPQAVAADPNNALARGGLRVTAMAQMRDGSVWLGGDSELHQLSRERLPLRVLRHDGGQTRRLLAGRDGSLWVCTLDGLYRLRPGATRLERLAQQGGKPLHGEIHAIAEGADSTLWVGATKGLFRVAPGGNELQPVVAREGAGLGNPTVIGLLIDHHQTLWLDTAVTGLHRMRGWDGRQASFDRVSERHGIVSHPFGVNLLEDGRGRIWTQMNLYDPATDRLNELTAADGVDIGTGWFGSYTETADGRLLFGGSKGLLVVEPDGFDVSSYAPPLVVSELRVNGEREPAGQILNGLQLKPDSRSFSVEFSALDYGDPGRCRYTYRLAGFDPAWIKSDAEHRDASYSNLNPGHYVLRVRATNRSGLWSAHELAVDVQVLPAWWQSWWFRAMLLLMLAALFYAGVHLRTRQLRWRQQGLERMVRERTAELEAMAKTLQQESAALAQASLTDPLTGLRNRRFLAQHIEPDAALAVRQYDGQAQYGAAPPSDADLIFFLIDIDQFKQVHDLHGHAAGDAVIMQMRGRLQQVFRDSDYLVRWGGEEFLIVARGTSRAHAAELAERARAVVADQPFELPDGSLLAKTCSVGFCCFPLAPQHASALDWNAAVNAADAALYAVKSTGRNGWLGLLRVRGESPEALRAGSRRPLAEWWQSGDLDVAHSAGCVSWVGSETQPPGR